MSRSSKGPRSNQMEVKVEVEVQVLKERASGSVKLNTKLANTCEHSRKENHTRIVMLRRPELEKEAN
eukprot:scaffold4298_cov166-Skeletonema_marinoi.AAC.3